MEYKTTNNLLIDLLKKTSSFFFFFLKIFVIKKEFIFPYKTKYYPCFIGKYLLRFCPKNNTNKTTYYIDLIYCDLWYIKRAGF